MHPTVRNTQKLCERLLGSHVKLYSPVAGQWERECCVNLNIPELSTIYKLSVLLLKPLGSHLILQWRLISGDFHIVIEISFLLRGWYWLCNSILIGPWLTIDSKLKARNTFRDMLLRECFPFFFFLLMLNWHIEKRQNSPRFWKHVLFPLSIYCR